MKKGQEGGSEVGSQWRARCEPTKREDLAADLSIFDSHDSDVVGSILAEGILFIFVDYFFIYTLSRGGDQEA